MSPVLQKNLLLGGIEQGKKTNQAEKLLQQAGYMRLNFGEGIVRDFAFIWPLKNTVF